MPFTEMDENTKAQVDYGNHRNDMKNQSKLRGDSGCMIAIITLLGSGLFSIVFALSFLF